MVLIMDILERARKLIKEEWFEKKKRESSLICFSDLGNLWMMSL